MSEFVPELGNPRIETRPLRFVMDRTDSNGNCHELRIEQLSEGYKIVIAMVADLAARMAEANPEMENPLEGPGIVLVDEIDLHLHPQWQRVIITQLASVFKNIQFVVTTHSPIIVVGASGVAQIVNLNNASLDSIEPDDLSKSNIGLVLLSDLFGLQTLQSPQWDAKIKEREELLSQSELSEDEKQRLRELDDEMRDLSTTQHPSAAQTDMLIAKIADELNIKL